MTIVKAFWLDGSDIHLLPRLVSPRLDQIMFLFDGNRLFRADERDPSVNVLFVPRFAGSPDNHGVRVDVQTGEVTVASPLPGPPRLRSFVIEATVSDPGPPGSGQPPSSFQLSVRVNVHEDIERMWLTPSPLTVRENAKGVRFTVLAEFDDGAIGDITNWAPSATPLTGDRSFVHVDGSGAPELTWSEGPGPVTVDAVTGQLTLTAAADQATRITARRPFPEPVPPSASASADARCAGPWSDPVRLAHIHGPGFAAMADEGVRNVLFLPDGFTGSEDDKAAFERCVRVIVSRLSVRARTRPWDLLTERFNYFRAWVPSPQTGVSVLNELDRAVEGGATVGYALEHALKPAAAKPSWLINELLFEVGPPAPDHDTPGSPLGTVTSGRLQDWRTLYGTHVTAARVNPTYPAWLDRSDRVLLNERDTAFHTAMGERPRVDQQAPPRALQFHPLRMHFDDFDDFLRALTDDQGNELPEKVWGRTGKDENLVTIVCRTNRHAAANSRRGTTGKYLCVGLNDATTHQLTTNPDDDGFDVRPDPVPATVSVTTWTAVAHELAHSFDLGDEYGNQSGGGPTILPAAEAPKLAAKPNVQPRGELEDADGKLIATSLTNPKWGAWPRIAKAGVLADDPEDLSGGRGEGPFVLRLQPGHGGAFEFHDVIRLRRRPLATAGAASDRLKVTSVDLDQLTAERLEVAALDPAGFPAGQTAAARGVPASIVLVPLRAEDPLPGMDVYGDDLGLVAQSVRARIDETHNPLNASDLEAADRPCQPLLGEAFKYPTDAINFPGGTAPKPPRWSPWIVGLYEGGNEYDCGVYRPTGMCMMRRQLTITDEQTFVYSFCPVCRYAMVDLLDPTRHGDIDRDYESRYPA
jgi:IgA Peptidase M64